MSRTAPAQSLHLSASPAQVSPIRQIPFIVPVRIMIASETEQPAPKRRLEYPSAVGARALRFGEQRPVAVAVYFLPPPEGDRHVPTPACPSVSRFPRAHVCPDKRGKGPASALNVARKQPVEAEPDIGCQLAAGLSGDHVAVGLQGRMEKLP